MNGFAFYTTSMAECQFDCELKYFIDDVENEAIFDLILQKFKYN